MFLENLAEEEDIICTLRLSKNASLSESAQTFSRIICDPLAFGLCFFVCGSSNSFLEGLLSAFLRLR